MTYWVDTSEQNGVSDDHHNQLHTILSDKFKGPLCSSNERGKGALTKNSSSTV